MQIGKIHIDKPLLLAPMEDVTDQAFRIVCKRRGADVVFTEFVNSDGLVRNSNKTKQKMNFTEEERPCGIQIYGGVEESMEGAARMAEGMLPDLIDINCGCWVRKVVGHGAGSDLLRDLPRMEKIVSTVVKTVQLPVTVKTRLGWDLESIRIVEVAKMLEQTGIAGLTIHCRTRSQAHKGEPDYSWIQKVKSVVSIPVIINGSLDTPEKIENAFRDTGCDGVMIGRGAIDNPWIFQQAKQYRINPLSIHEPTIEERFQLLFEHFQFSIEIKGERKAIFEFRKHYAGYLKGFPNASRVRIGLMQYTEPQPILDTLNTYKQSLLERDEEISLQ